MSEAANHTLVVSKRLAAGAEDTEFSCPAVMRVIRRAVSEPDYHARLLANPAAVLDEEGLTGLERSALLKHAEALTGKSIEELMRGALAYYWGREIYYPATAKA